MLKPIRKRFVPKARKLLKHLRDKKSNIKWDKFGTISINNQVYPTLNIFEALGFSFYETVSKPTPKEASIWFKNLESIGASSLVTNAKWKKVDDKNAPSLPSNWYFLGEDI